MSYKFPHLAARIFNTPLAIHPDKAQVVIHALGDRFGIESLQDVSGNIVLAGDVEYKQANPNEEHAYGIHEGIAIIPVKGTLMQETFSLRPKSGETGYDGIRQNFIHAINNKKIKAIIFDINSPGGEVSGCFDLVDAIFEMRNEKPIISILSESAYSAAYAIASASHRITMPRTGGAGSIGVIAMHVDYSSALADAGIKVTMIKHGKRKADGNPYEALKGDALNKIQSDIDTMGQLFIETVARNRNLKEDDVRAMEAACFLGKDAVDNGLVDDIVRPDIEFNNLIDTIT